MSEPQTRARTNPISLTTPPTRATDGPSAPSPAAGWFDTVYRDAADDAGAVPWADQRANPVMVTWLNAVAPGLIRTGSRVAVVGCGLGDDVNELAARGYDVVGFDVSATAIEWARRRFPELGQSFIHADLFDLPARFIHRFDLVVEINTLQSLEPTLRQRAAMCVMNLACPRGSVLTIARGRDEQVSLADAGGPPFPFTSRELLQTMESVGAAPISSIDEFDDDEQPPVRRLRGVFQHA